MTDIDYTRTYANSDSVTVNNNSNQWGITRTEEVLRLWLRIPDTAEGTLKLMEYSWDQDAWTEVVE